MKASVANGDVLPGVKIYLDDVYQLRVIAVDTVEGYIDQLELNGLGNIKIVDGHSVPIRRYGKVEIKYD